MFIPPTVICAYAKFVGDLRSSANQICAETQSTMGKQIIKAFALLQRFSAPDWPSFISFITGPGWIINDIERILVPGIHRPKQLTIYCGLPPANNYDARAA